MAKFVATVASVQGQPAMLVNGKPVFLNAPFLFKAPYDSFVQAKTGIYMIYDPPIPIAPDGSVDTSSIKQEADALLAREPEALMVLRTCCRPPAWWLDKYPEHTVRFDRDVASFYGGENYPKLRDAS